MGPGQNDSGRRVTVLHSNQGPRQCGHCLKSASPSASTDPKSPSFCQGGGNAKSCKSINPVRTKMSSYIGELRSECYSSLRDTYFETLRTSFPLLGSSQPLQPLDMSQVDLHDHQDDNDGEDDEYQHKEIDNTSSPPINDNNTETPDHPNRYTRLENLAWSHSVF